MRRDLGEITGVDQSKMPFVLGEITSNHAAFGNATPAYIDVVCQAQLDVAAALDNVFVLDTTGLAQQDNWHYTADAQITIGEKFVEIALAASGDIPTAYGIVPKESVYDENGVKIPLAMFQNGKYLASYSDWNAAMTDAKAKLSGKAKDAVQVEVVLMDNFTAGKYEVTQGDLFVYTLVYEPLIDAFVVTADQNEIIHFAQANGICLAEGATTG